MIFGNNLPVVVAAATLLIFGNHEILVSSQIDFRKGAPTVRFSDNQTLSGSLMYARDGRPFSAFVGITFANVPERFAEAELIPTEEAWEGVRNATTPGEMCSQMAWASNPEDDPIGNEQCLNLNIFVPLTVKRNEKGRFPVMVYLHGGAYMMGTGFIYGPHLLMDEDVIVVTINYRVGIFGFLSTGDELVPGNNGLKDSVIALQWVQKYIKSFGGDPSNVYVFGESAGGSLTHYLTLSPTSKGLFRGAIAQSGSAHATWGYYPDARDTAVKLATYMNCPTNAASASEISSQEMVSCFKQASVQELTKATQNFKQGIPKNFNNFFFGPTAEPESLKKQSSVTPFLTKSPYALLKDKSAPISEVPLVIGLTEDEGATLFSCMVLSNDSLIQDLDKNWDKLAPEAFGFQHWAPKADWETIAKKIRQFYFKDKPVSLETRDNLTNLYTDLWFAYGIQKSAIELASRGKQPVYFYQYAWIPPKAASDLWEPCTEEEKTKAGHGAEVSMEFELFKMELPDSDIKLYEVDSDHYQFSKNFIKLLVSFAVDGKPNHTWGDSINREWKPISEAESKGKVPLTLYRIDGNPGHITNPYEERNAFWEQLHKDHFETILLSNPSTLNMKNSL